MCCRLCQRFRVWMLRLRGASRTGDWWVLEDKNGHGRTALLDPSKLL